MTLAAAPTVCLAHDGSPLAMRVAADISRQLVPMRCRLVSLGHGSRPSLDFAVDHLSASAGLYVESGESPAGVGFSVVGRGGIPWSLGGRLDRVRGLQDQGIRRTSRTGGVVTAFDATAPYRAGLIRSFQDLRGLEIAVGGLSEFALRCWSDIAEQVSCRLHPIPASPRIENGEPSRASLRPLMDAIVEHRWDGGLVFDADGRRLWAIDRRDGLVSQRDVCGWIARDLAGERNLRGLKTVAYESTMWLDLSVAHAAVSFAPDSNESLVREMLESNAPLAADGQGRFWIADPTPRCDALVTAASVLRHWSRQRLRTAA
jgi:phosphomannomutase